jgi:hypothetical protein
MRLSGQNVLHSEAMKWYYGWVAGHGPGVPGSIAHHIRQCLICRKQTSRLKEAVTGAGGETDVRRSEMKRDIIDTLSLHFGCLGEQVNCSRVKPFLPGLLVPALRIRIPTPITVHLDHCTECAEDLEALRDLNLSAEQLERLEHLYSQKHPEDPRLCRRARTRIAAFVRGSLDEIDPEILDHLCTCPSCRQRVYRGRQKLLDNGAIGRVKVCGEEIPTVQLFDYAVPYGRTTGITDRAGASHVQACRPCLRAIQGLDETVYGIAERTNSGVATIYSTVEDAEGLPGATTDPYADYPVRVQVIRGRPQQAVQPSLRARLEHAWASLHFKTAVKRTSCDPRVRFILKTAVAAAAVIPLAMLLLTTTTASGVTFAKMFQAFGRADNVYLSQFDTARGKLMQEQLLARRADLMFTATEQECTLDDWRGKKHYSYSALGVPADVTNMSQRQYANGRRFIDACLGFGLDAVRGAQWTRVSEGQGGDADTYELVYPDGTRKWTVVVDPSTRLPKELQTLWRASTALEWKCLLRTEVRYLRAEEMKRAFESRHIPWPR